MKLASVLVFCLLFTGFSNAFAVSCPAPTFTQSADVKTLGDSLLIVTHPSTMWDGRFSSKAGMDSAVAFAKNRNIPVIYLQDDNVKTTNTTYFFSDCNPTAWVASAGGEFSFDVTASHVYSVGGHWELCQGTTQDVLMMSWKKNLDGKDLTFTQVMDGLYTYGAYFRSTDSYYSDFSRFMEIVFYGNPRNDWYVRKLSLLESMGIIKDKAKQIEFLKRNLPDYSNFKNYKVELWFNEELVETLQNGTGPVMKFEFVNSLYEGGMIPVL